jgi:hypothetical protein
MFNYAYCGSCRPKVVCVEYSSERKLLEQFFTRVLAAALLSGEITLLRAFPASGQT